jgi:phage terminase large subunit-like protein
MEGVIFEKLRQWVPKDQLGGLVGEGVRQDPTEAELRERLPVLVHDVRAGPRQVRRRSLDRVHYDEEPPEAIRKECRARLDRPGTDELFTMTPLQGMTWMYDGVYERGTRTT